MAVTFLVTLPLTQVMVFFFAVWTLTGAGAAWLSFTLKVGAEKVKPFAARVSHPFRSPTTVVATWAVPSDEMIETEADIGAFEKP